MDASSHASKYDGSTYPAEAAEAYELHMVPVLFGPWARDLLDIVDSRDGERVLDVACGDTARPGAQTNQR